MKLEIGYQHAFEVRKEHYTINHDMNFSVLYLSDFHFNKYSQPATIKIIDKINELNPNIILLGGDYVDTEAGLLWLNALMSDLSCRVNVFAIAGNHDYFFGINRIKEIMKINNVIWIEKDTYTAKIKNINIHIDGNQCETEKSKADFYILCLHKPIDIRDYTDKYHLVFGGHLHGGQFVFWKSTKGLYPGRLFYKWNILKAKYSDCQYFISKGLGDTLPIRYNCKKDMILVEVSTSNQLNNNS